MSDVFCPTCGYVELDVHGRCSRCGSEHVVVRPARKYRVIRSTNDANGRNRFVMESGLNWESAKRLADSLTTQYRAEHPLVSSWVADLFYS